MGAGAIAVLMQLLRQQTPAPLEGQVVWCLAALAGFAQASRANRDALLAAGARALPILLALLSHGPHCQRRAARTAGHLAKRAPAGGNARCCDALLVNDNTPAELLTSNLRALIYAINHRPAGQQTVWVLGINARHSRLSAPTRQAVGQYRCQPGRPYACRRCRTGHSAVLLGRILSQSAATAAPRDCAVIETLLGTSTEGHRPPSATTHSACAGPPWRWRPRARVFVLREFEQGGNVGMGQNGYAGSEWIFQQTG